MARIIKTRGDRTVLAETPFDWDPDTTYTAEFAAERNRLEGNIDGITFLEAVDEGQPPRGGGVGLVVEEAHLLAAQFHCLRSELLTYGWAPALSEGNAGAPLSLATLNNCESVRQVQCQPENPSMKVPTCGHAIYCVAAGVADRFAERRAPRIEAEDAVLNSASV